MDIIYAAEKPSIAGILSDHLKHRIEPDDIDVRDDPSETGSFLIRWNLESFVLSPSGALKTTPAVD